MMKLFAGLVKFLMTWQDLRKVKTLLPQLKDALKKSLSARNGHFFYG